jgi:ribosome-binding protein aMBF1 (putative translation factor)
MTTTTMFNQDTPALIRALRQRLGLSQEKLAATLGVSFQTVTDGSGAMLSRLNWHSMLLSTC